MMHPIIAILRGIRPNEAAPIARALVAAGITQIEAPLSAPDSFDSISAMLDAVGDDARIGAGTVLNRSDVARLAALGTRLVVSPDCNPDVIGATKAAGMLSYPGVFTATEAFTALRAGADGLKFFPAFKLGADGFKALSAVLPTGCESYAVGGIGPENFAEWLGAGISGFGIGSHLYRPGATAEDVGDRARKIVDAYTAVRK